MAEAQVEDVTELLEGSSLGEKNAGANQVAVFT